MPLVAAQQVNSIISLSTQQVVTFCSDVMLCFSSTAVFGDTSSFSLQEGADEGELIRKKPQKTSGSSPQSTGILLLKRQRSQEREE